MSFRWILLAGFGLAAACAAEQNTESAAPETPAPQAAVDGAPVEIGRAHQIDSTVFDGQRRIAVRLPAEYNANPEMRFPVVYVIDGGPEQDFPHLAGLAQSREMNFTFSPFILVGVETVNRREEITPPASDADLYKEWLGAVPGGSADFRRFMRDDVMAWVDAQYRTNGRTAVMGESLAGLFIVETLFEDPDLFDDYIAISPSMWWEEKKYGRDAAAYLANMPTDERRLYLTMGDEGYWMQEGLDLLIDALETDAPEGLSWVYVDRRNSETHASIYHGAALDAWRLFYAEPTRIYRVPPLLDGKPATPRTAEHEARLAEECSRETAKRATPEDTRDDPDQYAYLCFLYDYGERAAAGNFER